MSFLDIELYALFKTCFDNLMFLIVALEFSNFLTYFRTALSPFFYISSMIDFTVEETEFDALRDEYKLDKIQFLLTIFTINL